MTAQFIQDINDVFPTLPREAAYAAIVSGEVELNDGTRLTLGVSILELLEVLRTGLADDKVAHLELDEELLPAERAAELLHVSRPTIYAWQDRGRLGRVDRGAKRLVPFADVARLQSSPVRQAALATAAGLDRQGPEPEITSGELDELFGPDRLAPS